jgi:hypothetical protein
MFVIRERRYAHPVAKGTEVKDFSAHGMKAYTWSRVTAPLILDVEHIEISGVCHTPAALHPGRRPALPTA